MATSLEYHSNFSNNLNTHAFLLISNNKTFFSSIAALAIIFLAIFDLPDPCDIAIYDSTSMILKLGTIMYESFLLGKVAMSSFLVKTYATNQLSRSLIYT